MDINASKFVEEKTVKVRYVYEVELDEDGNLAYVKYKRYSVEDKKNVSRFLNVEDFAQHIFKGEWIAYAGKLVKCDKDKEKLTNVSLITVLTVGGKLYLTTASDDTISNNLKSLPKFKHE